jgi:hypothetical protein
LNVAALGHGARRRAGLTLARYHLVTTMITRLFPKTIDNDYRGSFIALVLFLPVLAMKTLIGFNVSGLNPYVDTRRILISADGVPLDSFGAAAAEQVIFSSASWGLALLLLCALTIVALIRYRSMIPMLILLFAAEQIGRKAIGIKAFGPPETAAEPTFGFYINWAFTIALVLAFLLSLSERRRGV